jgi:hypothetical protein
MQDTDPFICPGKFFLYLHTFIRTPVVRQKKFKVPAALPQDTFHCAPKGFPGLVDRYDHRNRRHWPYLLSYSGWFLPLSGYFKYYFKCCFKCCVIDTYDYLYK